MIRDGYGGEDALEGGAYRWKYGDAFLLRRDTLESLHGREWNDMYSHYDAVVNDADDDRPRIDINGYALAAIAKNLGL
ncbi:MAG TPA: hypothetical protein EYP35_04350 [Desulfobacterales bacterium]|nr:hypothetical protein [Desulfobacterales bacterium]